MLEILETGGRVDVGGSESSSAKVATYSSNVSEANTPEDKKSSQEKAKIARQCAVRKEQEGQRQNATKQEP